MHGHEALFDGVNDQRDPAFDLEFAEDEPVRDLLVAKARADQLTHFLLTGGDGDGFL